jgi:hypothetical protein
VLTPPHDRPQDQSNTSHIPQTVEEGEFASSLARPQTKYITHHASPWTIQTGLIKVKNTYAALDISPYIIPMEIAVRTTISVQLPRKLNDIPKIDECFFRPPKCRIIAL